MPSLALVLEKYHQAILEAKVVRWEETTTYPTGTITGEVMISPISDETGRCTHLAGMVHDLTEVRRTAAEKEQLQEQLRQAQKLESIGRLAGGVAHDFNNLLTIINGYAGLLAEQLRANLPCRHTPRRSRRRGIMRPLSPASCSPLAANRSSVRGRST